MIIITAILKSYNLPLPWAYIKIILNNKELSSIKSQSIVFSRWRLSMFYSCVCLADEAGQIFSKPLRIRLRGSPLFPCGPLLPLVH